jgi:hypothetical protein
MVSAPRDPPGVLDGEIYDMAGGTPEHAALCVGVSAALLARLGRRLAPREFGQAEAAEIRAL